MTTAIVRFFLPLLVAMMAVSASRFDHPSPCGFNFQQAEAVGYGEMLSFPGLWNEEGCTIVTVDQGNGNILLYPQLRVGSEFDSLVESKNSTRISTDSEVFLMFSPDGKFKWSLTAYSSTYPILDEDVYIVSEKVVTRYRAQDGSTRWAHPLCQRYGAAPGKMMSDAFPVSRKQFVGFATEDVVKDKEDNLLAIGLLISPGGFCELALDEMQGVERRVNLTTKPPQNNKDFSVEGYSTPYIVFVNKATGVVVRYEAFDSVKSNWIKRAERVAIPPNGAASNQKQSDSTATTTTTTSSTSSPTATLFLGMVLEDERTVLEVARYVGTRQQWTARVTTPHPHDYRMAQGFANYAMNTETLFVADPTSSMELWGSAFRGQEAMIINHRGLVFGAIDEDGIVSWTKVIDYEGVITSTYVGFLDRTLVLVGAVWDGQSDLIFGADLKLPALRRPVQGMLGFFTVYSTVDKRFLFVQEVAPEVSFPGMHIGVWRLPVEGSAPRQYQIVSAPAFWDNAPTRLVDNINSVDLPVPDADMVVLARWRYTPCRDTTATSVPVRGSKGGGHFLRKLLVAILVLAFLGGVAAVILNYLKRQGYQLPQIPVPEFIRRLIDGTPEYRSLTRVNENDEDEDDDDLDAENRPM